MEEDDPYLQPLGGSPAVNEMRAFTRQEWMDLRPEIYLADGYLDADGALRGDFLSDYATAAATQLMAAELSPQELAFAVEGLRQILPMHEGGPGDQLHAALDETLFVVARATQQTNNEGMVHWLSECAAAVGTAADLDGFMAHIQAVMRLYAILVVSQPDSSGSPSEA